ncbi:hypothetical protein P168DRAFT_89967 [Aspergillus campestris IBT 28561]|uniref:Uncharacterized protein n=1 Tax=Aspergillus campestris (strain IBT 28561) TaxID=1392248 RepID=A0A2I1DBC6_ASPC2|nr:uncharacterized protein P168DRAFT_89967 [Aspergillus campestris IBT 28561]PKY07182.1 hypothetical protein P168DRAFT_89967 [Aspergillus campestris IBT 28561]
MIEHLISLSAQSRYSVIVRGKSPTNRITLPSVPPQWLPTFSPLRPSRWLCDQHQVLTLHQPNLHHIHPDCLFDCICFVSLDLRFLDCIVVSWWTLHKSDRIRPSSFCAFVVIRVCSTRSRINPARD